MQLVGQSCIHCRERITRDPDGRFCSRCHSPVHLACIQKAFESSQERACPECGAPRSVLREQAKAERQRENEERERGKLNTMMAGMALLVGGLAVSGCCTAMSWTAGGGNVVVVPWAIGGGFILVVVGMIVALKR